MQDWYFRSAEQLEDHMNFCDPSTMLTDEFMQAVQSVATGHSVEAPNMDMATFERLPGSRHVRSGQPVFVEGMTIFRFPFIYSLFQLRLYLRLPVEELRRRKLLRDGQDRARSVEQTLKQLEDWVIPEYRRDESLLGDDIVFLDARRPVIELCEDTARQINALLAASESRE
jgi:uridine kinase